MSADNFDVKKVRSRLFKHLDGVLKVSQEKFSRERNSDSNRRSWARILVNAIEAYAKILHDVELEQLEARVRALEARDT